MGKTTTKSTKMTTTQINKNVHFTKKLCGRFLKKEGRAAYEQIVLGLHGFNGQKGVHRAANKLLRWRLQRISSKKASLAIAKAKRAYKKFTPDEKSFLEKGMCFIYLNKNRLADEGCL